MPDRITSVTLTQKVADIETFLRRRRVNLGQQTLTWAYDRFVAPATYQLTYLPYGINVLADNGDALAEGTDYTVDYTTGLVTFGTGRTSGHVIYVSYVTTGDLVAASTAPDTGGFVDNFNRADSTTTLGTTSDGKATWAVTGGFAFGISSNTAYQASGFGRAYAVIDCAATDGTVQATVSSLSAGWSIGITFRYADSNNNFYVYCKVGANQAFLYRRVGGTQALLKTFTAVDGDVIAATFSGTAVTLKQNGTSIYTDPIADTGLTANTKHGLVGENPNGAHVDDWSFAL